ncbi:MAG: hypothetical protein HY698_02115 [Deltaproteobacteria bacterium]|nr:hypothetical protein [Deltaproteobacteria bacterium]
MVKQVADYAQKMQGILKRVVQLQEVARRQKDVIKLNCVNDKHLQIKQLMNIADGASTNLQEAIARNDDDAREHEFHRIQITSEQVTVLATEAENCIGEDFTFFGDTQVTVEQPEEPEDPTQAADPGVPDIEPIPVASPFV